MPNSHKGYGATRGSGRLPNATFTIGFSGGDVAMQVALLADEIKNAAIQLNTSPRQVLKEMREAGIIDCSDEAAEAAIAMLGPSPAGGY